MAPDVEDTLCQAYQEIHQASEQEAKELVGSFAR